MPKDRDAPHPLSSPVSAGTLIDYQEGSVVSRTLASAPGGNLTLFAFDQGEGLSEHTTPHEAVVQILDGRALVTIGKDEYEVGEGEALLLPGGVPHALQAPVPFKMLLVMLKQG